MKKIIFLFLIVFLIILVIIVSFISKNKTQSMPSFPTPTPAQVVPNGAESNSYQISQDDKIRINQQYAISRLTTKLPYKGKDFSLSFSYNSANFLLTLNQNNLTAANSGFDDYLRQNGIQDRYWFNNSLIITSEPFVTPAP